MADEEDGEDDVLAAIRGLRKHNDSRFWLFILSALLVGGGNGLLTVTKTTDRFTTTDAAREREITSARFDQHESRITRNESTIRYIDENGPRNPPKEVSAQLVDLQIRVRALEREMDRNELHKSPQFSMP